MEYTINSQKIKIPDNFIKGKSMPEDPKDSICFVSRTGESDSMALIYPISEEKSMPFDDNNKIINGIHQSLKENQGLIEVANGTTKGNNPYVYSIVKTLQKPSGVQYFLCMHIKYENEIICINLYSSEVGRTGKRDSMIFNEMIGKSVTDINMNGWAKDPYDDNYKKGNLMNISEKREYDSRFPNHPLSVVRNFVDYIIGE